MINVSTKLGDKGKTGLANGERLPKSEPVFEAIGTLDELNSWLGVVISQMDGRFGEHRDFLLKMQEELFVIGGELARAKGCKLSSKVLDQIEINSEVLQKQMAEGWQTQFVMPGGTELAAWLDVARTVCRRSERVLVLYSVKYKVRPLLLKTLNRLSDYLYVLRSFVNWSSQVKEKAFEVKK